LASVHDPGGCLCEELDSNNVCRRCGCQVRRFTVTEGQEQDLRRLLEIMEERDCHYGEAVEILRFKQASSN
jgi:hypothetical protein